MYLRSHVGLVTHMLLIFLLSMSELEQYAGYDRLDVVKTPQFTRRKNANFLKEKQKILIERIIKHFKETETLNRTLSAVKR